MLVLKWYDDLGFETSSKRVYTRAMNWIKNFFNKIYEVLKKSYKALVEFMDFEPQVRFNNNIDWPS